VVLGDGWGVMRDDELVRWRDFYATRVALADAEITAGLPALTADELRRIAPALRAAFVSRGGHLAVSAEALRASTVAFLRARVDEADRERSRRLRTAHLRATTGLPQFPADWLADLKRRVNLDGVIEHECGVALGRMTASKQRRGACPFCHASAASGAFCVYLADPDDEAFWCFGCGEHGDAIALIEAVYRVPFRAAVEILAAHCGLALPIPADSGLPAPDPDLAILAHARAPTRQARRRGPVFPA
jgi:hypothetical protein